ncbi:spherulin-4 [Ceratobasidium sp. AG-Ba]|nr:spherulin-4 [Ceratobasidium sp. AG-Ba]
MLIARAALASGVIFPLYIYPGDNCVNWSSAISAVAAHPNLPFYWIINPNSGPGGVNNQPDANYQACVPKLRPSSNPNVKVIAYVRTGYGTGRSASDVQQDVHTYAQWGSSYRPSGIFFDEVPYQDSWRTTYKAYADYARSQITNAFVTLNPGTSAIASGYFSFADQIVTVEKYYKDFSPSDYTISSSTPASKQAVILHDSPSTLPTTTINQIIKTSKIGAVYITDDSQDTDGNPYDSFPSYWSSFLTAVETAAK